MGSSLSTVFKGIFLLEYSDFWIISFFLISAVLSFKDVTSISIVQTSIAIARYVTVLTMIIGCIVIYATNDAVIWPIREWDLHEFSNLFGTAVFAYLMHHSIPQMYKPILPQSSIPLVNAIGFLFATIVFLVVPLMGMLAFSTLDTFCYYNLAFKEKPVYFAYYIISFYMFLNIAALPVLTITIRTNMMKMCVPHLMPKSSFEVTRGSFIFTLVVSIPCCVASLLLGKYINFLVGITGGVCGTIIMMIIPAGLISKARRSCPLKYMDNPFRSFFLSNIWSYVIFVAGVIIVPYNVYTQIQTLVNQVTNGSSCIST